MKKKINARQGKSIFLSSKHSNHESRCRDEVFSLDPLEPKEWEMPKAMKREPPTLCQLIPASVNASLQVYDAEEDMHDAQQAHSPLKHEYSV